MVPPKFPIGMGKANLIGDLLKESENIISQYCPHCREMMKLAVAGRFKPRQSGFEIHTLNHSDLLSVCI